MMLELIDRSPVRSPLRRGPTLLHAECPIEQAVTSADRAVQEALLREIWRRAPAPAHGTVLIAQPDRLRVLARTEGLLRPAVDALVDRHGSEIEIHPPQIRYALGPPVLEPHMSVSIAGVAESLARVRHDLERRRARIGRIDVDQGHFTLEVEAPLAWLLGYEAWLDDATGGTADASLRLSRYLPIDDGGPAAA